MLGEHTEPHKSVPTPKGGTFVEAIIGTGDLAKVARMLVHEARERTVAWGACSPEHDRRLTTADLDGWMFRPGRDGVQWVEGLVWDGDFLTDDISRVRWRYPASSE